MANRADDLWDMDGNVHSGRGNILLAASMICADPIQIGRDVLDLEQAGIDMLHIDVMDGSYVPRLGLSPEFVKAIKKSSSVPIDVHLMLFDLERFIPEFIKAGADLVFIHAEATRDLPRFLKIIRDLGAKPGVALNPATPPAVIEYVVDDIDAVLIMTTNPGQLGEQYLPAAVRKISDVRRLLGDRSAKVQITIDGNLNLQNAQESINRGATILVCGYSSIFRTGVLPGFGVKEFRTKLRELSEEPQSKETSVG
jgi:ribulose-phosphate 3-epimerase